MFYHNNSLKCQIFRYPSKKSYSFDLIVVSVSDYILYSLFSLQIFEVSWRRSIPFFNWNEYRFILILFFFDMINNIEETDMCRTDYGQSFPMPSLHIFIRMRESQIVLGDRSDRLLGSNLGGTRIRFWMCPRT
jgi:hypothetical protein